MLQIFNFTCCGCVTPVVVVVAAAAVDIGGGSVTSYAIAGVIEFVVPPVMDDRPT